MNQLEERLTDLLDRSADAIEVQPTVERVLDPTQVIHLDETRVPGRRRVGAIVAGAAAAILVLAAVVAVSRPTRNDVEVEAPAGPTEDGTPTGPTGDVEEAPQRSSAYEIEIGPNEIDANGESYTDEAGRTLTLTRGEAEHFDASSEARSLEARDQWTMTIDGHEAVVYDGEGEASFYALWLEDDHFFELRGDNFTRDDFETAVSEVEVDNYPSSLVELTEERFTVETGDLVLNRGDAEQFDAISEDRSLEAHDQWTMTITGHDGTRHEGVAYEREGANPDETIVSTLWLQGDYYFELHGNFTREEFESTAASIRVHEDAALALLPDDTVTSD